MLQLFSGMALKDSGERTSYQRAGPQAIKVVVHFARKERERCGSTLNHRKFLVVCLECWKLERNKIGGVII